MSLADVAGPVLGAAIALLAVLLLAVALLARRYRSECHQLRARNAQLSCENDRWHEDFSAQAGELTALRRLVPMPSAGVDSALDRIVDISRAEAQ